MSGFFDIDKDAELSDTTPEDAGATASAGTSVEASRSDHVHELVYDIPAGAVSFDTTPSGISDAEGKVYWDTDFGTLSVVMTGGNVTLPIGQKAGAEVKNKTGNQINIGQVVQFDDASGGNIEVALAVNDGTISPKMYFGVAAENILDDGEGFVVTTGYIRKINTTGLAVGTLLYIDDSTPGLLTDTMPSKPAFIKPIAVVTLEDNNGVIYVRIPDGATLNETFDVDTTGASTGDLLGYNGTNWVSVPTPAEYGDGDNFRPHPLPPAGSWFQSWSSSSSFNAAPVDVVGCVPLVVEENVTIDRIGLQIISVLGMTGTYTYEMALFAGTETGPTTLITNYGTVAISNVTTPGTHSITISENLTANTIYWLVYGQTQTGGIGPMMYQSTGVSYPFLQRTNFGILGNTGSLVTTFTSGVVPAANFTGVPLGVTGASPRLHVRRAT